MNENISLGNYINFNIPDKNKDEDDQVVLEPKIESRDTLPFQGNIIDDNWYDNGIPDVEYVITNYKEVFKWQRSGRFSSIRVDDIPSKNQGTFCSHLAYGIKIGGHCFVPEDSGLDTYLSLYLKQRPSRVLGWQKFIRG